MLAVLLQTAVEKECALLDDWFGFFVQCMLGVAAFLSLVFKRYLEPVQRPWPTFLRDALKQGIGAGVVHVMNMGLSMMLREFGNECKWYFINFIADNIVGLLINVILLLLFERLARAYSCHIIESGKYSEDEPHTSWALQLGVWVLVVVLSKLIVFFALVLTLTTQLYAIGDFLLHGMDSNPKFELVFVMVIVPVILNVLQFWIQDNFLMYQEPETALYHKIAQTDPPDLTDPDSVVAVPVDKQAEHNE